MRMRPLLATVGLAVLAMGYATALATDVTGIVLRAPVVPTPRAVINRYKPTANDVAHASVENCQCNPAQYAVVYLEGDSLPPPRPLATHPTMSQQGKRFIPSVLAIPRGTTVDFPNLDPFFHNVFSYSKPKRFDLGRYPQGQSASVTFNEPGVIKVFCDIHASMRAYIHVLESPYVTVSDERGHFSLGDVAPGDYTLTVWQEGQVDLTQQVQIRGDSTYLEVAQ
jgi:hypothetical protein